MSFEVLKLMPDMPMQYVHLDTSDIGAAIRCELGTGPDGELRYEKRGDYMVISPCVPLEGAKENRYMRCKRGTVLIARSVPAQVAVCTYTLAPEDHDRLRVLYGATSITQEPTKKVVPRDKLHPIRGREYTLAGKRYTMCLVEVDAL